MNDQLALLFEAAIIDLPSPQKEYLFHPSRGWRMDYAWPRLKISVELQGGVFSGRSGHRSITGILRDIQKLNHAQYLGWRYFCLTKKDLHPKLSDSFHLMQMLVIQESMRL